MRKKKIKRDLSRYLRSRGIPFVDSMIAAKTILLIVIVYDTTIEKLEEEGIELDSLVYATILEKGIVLPIRRTVEFIDSDGELITRYII